MRRLAFCAAAVVGLFGIADAAVGQDNSLKAALTACMKQAVDSPALVVEVDDPTALNYACQGAAAVALFRAMEMVSGQTIDGDLTVRRAGRVVCNHLRTHQLDICMLSIEATAPFVKQAQ